jgi:hypothetical protein
VSKPFKKQVAKVIKKSIFYSYTTKFRPVLIYADSER